MNDANLQLSSAEMALVTDPAWILTKNSIMGKVVGMFALLSEEFGPLWKGGGPDLKISKGENYKGLPYVMLDYPRIFGREDVLAIRTMFWWGHAFTVTLHLKGQYKDLFLPVIRERWGVLAGAGYHVGVSEDEWRHEHVPDNYQRIGEGGGDELERVLRGQPFLKLSARCGLDRWEEAPAVLGELFRVLVSVLATAK
jgi:hypothetical protein